MHIVELICTRDGQIMETLDNIGIKLFALAALKEYQLYLSLYFCMFVLCSASINTLPISFSNSLYESTAKWKTVSVLKRRDYWCTFSRNICNEVYPEQQFPRLRWHKINHGNASSAREIVAGNQN